MTPIHNAFSMPVEAQPHEQNEEPTICSRITDLFYTFVSWIVYICTFGCLTTPEKDETNKTETVDTPKKEDRVKPLPVIEQIEQVAKLLGMKESGIEAFQLMAFIEMAQTLESLGAPGESIKITCDKEDQSLTVALPPSLQKHTVFLYEVAAACLKCFGRVEILEEATQDVDLSPSPTRARRGSKPFRPSLEVIRPLEAQKTIVFQYSPIDGADDISGQAGKVFFPELSSNLLRIARMSKSPTAIDEIELTDQRFVHPLASLIRFEKYVATLGDRRACLLARPQSDTYTPGFYLVKYSLDSGQFELLKKVFAAYAQKALCGEYFEFDSQTYTLIPKVAKFEEDGVHFMTEEKHKRGKLKLSAIASLQNTNVGDKYQTALLDALDNLPLNHPIDHFAGYPYKVTVWVEKEKAVPEAVANVFKGATVKVRDMALGGKKFDTHTYNLPK